MQVKTYFVICVVLFTWFQLHAQYDQPKQIFDAGETYSPVNLLIEDYNNDNALDIVSHDFFLEEPLLFTNLGDGSANVSTDIFNDIAVEIPSSNFFFWKTADFNSDGKMDIYFVSNIFMWMKNDGNGQFSFGDSISLSESSYFSDAVDINNDGWTDIILKSTFGETIEFMLNNGDGTFANQEAIVSDSTISNSSNFKLLDYNQDSWIDLVVYNNIETKIFLNNTDNTFSFLEQINYDLYLNDIEIRDYDLDNDFDIIGIGYSEIYLLTNNSSTYTQDTILSLENESYLTSYKIADIENNGQLDLAILASKYDENYDEYYNFTIYNNLTEQGFADTTLILDTTTILSFELVDFDVDTKIDLVFVKFDFYNTVNQGSNLGWIKNQDLLDDSIDSDNSNLLLDIDKVSFINRNIVFQNIDLDNQNEIIFTNSRKTLKNQLFLINGTSLNESFSVDTLYEYPVGNLNLDQTPNILIGDLNSDSTNDLIQKIDAEHYAIFLNDEENNLSVEPIIIDINSPDLLDFELFGLMDKENDGDLDIYSSFKFADGWRLVWLLNNGTGQFTSFEFIEAVPYNSEEGYKNMLVGDVDGDSDLDLVTYSNDFVAWYQNQGNGNYGTVNVVPSSDEFAELSIELVDLSGDGDLELFLFGGKVSCLSHYCYYDKKFYIYDFNSNDSQFELIQLLNSWPLEITTGIVELDLIPVFGFDINFDIVYKDFNDDSNLDIITISPDSGSLKVLLGDGEGNFDEEEIILTADVLKFDTDLYSIVKKVGLYITDIEKDGDLDLVYIKSSASKGSIYLIENKEIDFSEDADEDGIVLLYDCNDADSTILDTLLLPQIQTTLQNCEGDEIMFEIANLQNVNYTWQTPNGSNSNPSFEIESALVSDAGNYTVQASINQCESAVATVAVDVFENPEISIELVENTLEVISDNENLEVQWFLNNEVISGATNYSYIPTETGDYHVEVVNESGCSSTSETFSHIVNGIGFNQILAFNIYPNPVSNNGIINLDITSQQMQGEVTFLIKSISGQEVQKGILPRNGKIRIQNLTSGMYFMIIKSKQQIGKAHFVIVD